MRLRDSRRETLEGGGNLSIVRENRPRGHARARGTLTVSRARATVPARRQAHAPGAGLGGGGRVGKAAELVTSG